MATNSRSRFPPRKLLVLIVLGSLSGCASTQYSTSGPALNRDEPTNRVRCPPGAVPVCFERRGKIINCRCERNEDLGRVIG